MAGAAQAWHRVSELCRRIRRDRHIYEEERDPQVHDSLVLLHHLLGLGAQEDIVEECARALSMLYRLNTEREQHLPAIRFVNCAGPGRPQYNISFEQLEHLLHLQFDCPTIASMLGVSLRTIRRRMAEYNMTVRLCYSDIADEDLVQTVREIKEQFSNCGYRMMDGLLRQRGIRVQQMRLREVMHNTDPNGTVVRFTDLIQRRKYHVPGPQSLWHIDGNHKLIR